MTYSISPDSIKDKGTYYIIPWFPRYRFAVSLKKRYNTSKLSNIFEITGFLKSTRTGPVKVHKFFIPELVYLLRQMRYSRRLVNAVIDGTWLSRIRDDPKNRMDMSLISQKMNVTLRDHQKEFVEQYDVLRYKYNLNGFLLSFEQGLGKTITALAVMAGLDKKQVIILAPKNTLDSVWKAHIQDFFRQKVSISSSTDPQGIDPKADFLICTYASLDKLKDQLHEMPSRPEEIGVIVDESHNFLRQQSNRTQSLMQLQRILGCRDMLLQSGTPVKAMGVELMPLLMILDPFFDQEAMVIFKKALGVNTSIATDVLHSRLKVMMHRKLKDEVMELPPKYEKTIAVKMSNGSEYTIPKVRKKMEVFAADRTKYHIDHMQEYVATFYRVIEEIRRSVKDQNDLRDYLNLVEKWRKQPPTTLNPKDTEDIQWANKFEREHLIPTMSREQKTEFLRVKSAVKYLPLKVRGEVIGRLLSRLRMSMTTDMIANSPILTLIRESTKKTVIFTSYRESVTAAENWLKENKFTPIVVTGDNSGDVRSIISTFAKSPAINPLIASTPTMSTGVTLTMADTMVFLNKPWRYTDYNQAADRVHRIGCDSPVFIYTLVLDTGETPNLSTHAEDIINWSRDMFTQIVNG